MTIDLGFLEGIRDLGELNRLVYSVADLSETGPVTVARLRQRIQGSSVAGHIVRFDDLANTGAFLGLVDYDGLHYRNTGLAEALIQANPQDIIEFQPDQAAIVVKAILFKRSKAAWLAENAVRRFSFRKHLGRYQHHEYDVGQLDLHPGYRTFLMNLGFLRYDGLGIHFIDPIYTEDMKSKIRLLRASDWSEFEPSEEVLKRAKECERLVVASERARLKSIGRPDLADNVDWVADYDDRVGYDIQSYQDARSRKGLYDRFIEVKSNVTKTFSFIITETELNKAREKGAKYWVYYAGNYSLGKSLKDCQARWIRNPARILFDLDSFLLTARKLRVTLAGAGLPPPAVSPTPSEEGLPEDQ